MKDSFDKFMSLMEKHFPDRTYNTTPPSFFLNLFKMEYEIKTLMDAGLSQEMAEKNIVLSILELKREEELYETKLD